MQSYNNSFILRLEGVSSTTSDVSENSEAGRITETQKVDTDLAENEEHEKEVTEKTTPEKQFEEPFVVVTKTPSAVTEQLSSLGSSTSDIGNSDKESTDTEDSQDSEKSGSESEKVVLEKEESEVIGATQEDVEDEEEVSVR